MTSAVISAFDGAMLVSWSCDNCTGSGQVLLRVVCMTQVVREVVKSVFTIRVPAVQGIWSNLMKNILTSLAVTTVLSISAPAFAATQVVDGSCSSVASPSGCLFSGNINSNPGGNPNSFMRAEEAYNIYNDSHPSANPDIDLNILASSDDANFADFGSFAYNPGSTSAGTWDFTGFLVDFFAVKAGNQFVLYQLGSPSSTGSWNTDQLGGKDLSHLVFFGSAAGAVPEPSVWAMMIIGFGLIGAGLRRKNKAAVRFAF